MQLSHQDTTLLLEKRVKSRFSQRIYRVVSPLSSSSSDAWKDIVRNALIPKDVLDEVSSSGSERDGEWLAVWESLVDVGLRGDTARRVKLTDVLRIQTVLQDHAVQKAVRRVCELTTDVRILLRSFVSMTGTQTPPPTNAGVQINPVQQFGLHPADAQFQPATIVASISEQIHSTGWGKKLEKLRGLSSSWHLPRTSLTGATPFQAFRTRPWWY